MDTDRIGLDAGYAVADGLDNAFGHEAKHSLGYEIGIMKHRARQAARYERAVRVVGSIGKGFSNDPKPCLSRLVHQRGTGQCHQGEMGINSLDRRDDISRLPLVRSDRIVESSVWLDVSNRSPCCGGQSLQGADL